MNIEIPEYPEDVMRFIKQYQRIKLTGLYGIFFEKHLSTIFPSQQNFVDYISKSLDREFSDGSDERYELEAYLQNKALDKIPNATKYEFLQHKGILNATEITYRKIVDEKLLAKIPYNSTLYSLATDAVIINNSELDKSVIFFHSELFSANLMFCKLIVKLISSPLVIGTVESYSAFKLNDDPETLEIVNSNANAFYEYYFSQKSSDIPDYELHTQRENNILGILLDAIMLFIYSHECGHEYLQHFLNDDLKSTEEFWKEEYEADFFAMQVMGKYSTKMNKEILSLIAPVIFFRYLILSEKYSSSLDLQNTHPPTISRLNSYINWLRKVINSSDQDSLRIFLSFEDKLSNYIIGIFDNIHLSNATNNE
jgi:hypothetical protein